MLLGADVVGPAATTAEAERLLSEHAPDVALVDFYLRAGELSYGLITRSAFPWFEPYQAASASL